jgi:hypothetical protein
MSGTRGTVRRTAWAAGAGGLALGLAALAGGRWFEAWHRRWGATDEEVRMTLPGDELIAPPTSTCTRAITIDAPPAAVWPWVIQLGADRGGFYSYDRLENLFGLGIHSADRIVPEWQQREVGDLVFAISTGTGGWYVAEARPAEVLVLQLADVAKGRPVRRDDRNGWEFAWIFALLGRPDGTTRLLVREVTAIPSRRMQLAMAPIGPVSFVMTRRMLLGIRERVERAGRTSSTGG